MMLHLFATAELPNTVLGIMSAVITTLVGVVVYQNRKIESLYKEKSGDQEQRRLDMMGIIEKMNTLIVDFSQTAKMLLAKLDGGDK